MEMSLDRLKPGCCAAVTRMNTPKELTLRLRDYGLVPGTGVRCCYRSPGGKVTALELLDTVVAIRTRELKQILVRC